MAGLRETLQAAHVIFYILKLVTARQTVKEKDSNLTFLHK